jgi:hypothetical protein
MSGYEQWLKANPSRDEPEATDAETQEQYPVSHGPRGGRYYQGGAGASKGGQS